MRLKPCNIENQFEMKTTLLWSKTQRAVKTPEEKWEANKQSAELPSRAHSEGVDWREADNLNNQHMKLTGAKH